MLFVQWLNTRSIKTSSIWQESFTRNLSWLCIDRGVNLERRYSDCGSGRFGKMDATEIYPPRINAKEVLISQSGEEFKLPVADGTAKLSVRDYEFRESTLKAGTNRKERRSQWRTSRRTRRVSTDRIKRWRWSPCRLLVDSRWLHLSSSQGTSSLTLCTEGRSIPYSTEILWCNQVHSYWSGRHARKTCWWLLECRFEQTFVKFLAKIHKNSLLKETLHKGYMWSGERLTKVRTTARPDHVWPEVWSKIGKAAQNREKQEWKNEKAELDNARPLRGSYFILTKSARKPLKTRGKLERPMDAAMPCKKEIHSSTRKRAADLSASQVPRKIYGW